MSMNFAPALLRAGLVVLCAVVTTQVFAADTDRTIVAVTGREPPVMDPVLSNSAPSTEPLFLNIEEKLTDISNDGKTIPGIARSWDIKDGGKIVTFHLRQDVKFHTGDPLTVDDVIFSHQRGMKGSANYRAKLNGLNRVEKLDDFTVRFIFDEPNTGILYNNSLFIGSKAYFDRVGEEQYVAKPIGTGPYKLLDYRLGQYYLLQAFDSYWGEKKPDIKSIKVVLVKDESTKAAMLRAGEADFVEQVPYASVRQLQSEGFNLVGADTFPTMALTFQTYNPSTPWAKRDVRQAMAHAIDRTAIVKGLFQGVPKLYPYVHETEIGYDPNLKYYDYNPQIARKMLADAGYPNGFNMPMSITTAYDGQKQSGEAAALYLKQVGINVKIEVVNSLTNSATLRDKAKDPNFPYTLMRAVSIANVGDPAAAMYFSFYSETPTAIYKPSNPEFDKLLAAGVAEFDDQKRGEIVRKTVQMLHEDVGIIPLWNAVTYYGMKPGLEFTPQQHVRPFFSFINLHWKK